MLGGKVGEEGGEEGGAPGAGRHPAPKGKASKPMGVDEFLDKGLGGAQLPRKRCVTRAPPAARGACVRDCSADACAPSPPAPPAPCLDQLRYPPRCACARVRPLGRPWPCRQDRKDKEKEKRMRGQSTHAAWKSEAEMALRQQYD